MGKHVVDVIKEHIQTAHSAVDAALTVMKERMTLNADLPRQLQHEMRTVRAFLTCLSDLAEDCRTKGNKDAPSGPVLDMEQFLRGSN